MMPQLFTIGIQLTRERASHVQRIDKVLQAANLKLGSLLSDGASAINPVRNLSWLLIFPALTMATLLLALNFLGDALRDILDPRG